jgi:hypothetical protein
MIVQEHPKIPAGFFDVSWRKICYILILSGDSKYISIQAKNRVRKLAASRYVPYPH